MSPLPLRLWANSRYSASRSRCPYRWARASWYSFGPTEGASSATWRARTSTSSNMDSVSAPVTGPLRPPLVRRPRCRPVTKRRSRPEADFDEQNLMGELTERDDDPHVSEQREFAAQKRKAGIAFGRRGLVGRRGAADSRYHEGAGQGKPIVDAHALRLVGKARAPQGSEQPVAGPVAGEHPAGAIGTVGRRRQTYEQDPCCRVAETGNRTTPIVLVHKRGSLFDSHLFAPLDQTGAAATGHDLVSQRVEWRTAGVGQVPATSSSSAESEPSRSQPCSSWGPTSVWSDGPPMPSGSSPPPPSVAIASGSSNSTPASSSSTSSTSFTGSIDGSPSTASRKAGSRRSASSNASSPCSNVSVPWGRLQDPLPKK